MFKPLTYDIKEVIKLFSQKKTLELRGLSNRLIREASIENNVSKAELGVIAYSLHKMESKNHFVANSKWPKLRSAVIIGLEETLFAVEKDNSNLFISKIKRLIKIINNIDSNLGNYAQSIYDKAKVKQASLAYSYGLSISQSAELTGADKKELQNYIGFTLMHDEEKEIKSITNRVLELKKFVDGENNV
jgi:hypothetical protein